MEYFENEQGKSILFRMVHYIQDNKDYLGNIDGLIGDGDHGMNMNKGFSLFERRFKEKDFSFTDGLNDLGMILFNEIGGSMGPIYGNIFMSMSEKGGLLTDITLKDFEEMLRAGMEELFELIDARVGDKTLVDTLYPAVLSLSTSIEKNESFSTALCNMKKSAQNGKNSTINMIAKYGRSSRLGERSKGVLDAGAVSCCIILEAMADGISELLMK